MENINFKASFNQPNPLEVKYWVDLKTDSQGGIIKYYNYSTSAWEPIQKLDIKPGMTEDLVNDLIENYIVPSYDGIDLEVSIPRAFANLSKSIDNFVVELRYKDDELIDYVRLNTLSILDLSDRVSTLETKP